MNCRDFLTEFEEREPLSETATLHLNDCAGCKKVKDQQTRVWQMFETLETVDTPKDFNFRVKARIANAKSTDFQPRLLPALRYVLPLSLAVVVFAFVVFNGVYFLDNNSVHEIAQSSQPSFAENENPYGSPSATPIEMAKAFEIQTGEDLNANASVQTAPQRDTKPPVNKDFITVKSSKTLPKVPRKNDENTDSSGGSSRISSSTSSRIFTPRSVDANTATGNAPRPENKISLTAAEILSPLGMEIVSENGKLRVKSITQNGFAARSGVKVGDIIEAIDGAKLTNEPFRSKTIAVKKINILRDGAKKEISLHY